MEKKQIASSQALERKVTFSHLSADCLLDPPILPLPISEVHVWEFPLDLLDSFFGKVTDNLSDDERTRAARFHFEKDGRRFAVARGFIRSILGGYTRVPARDLSFAYSRHGKPSLINDPEGIRFSISHSGDWALLAVALERDVGVDIEAIRSDVEIEKLAERFFSLEERQSLRLLPAEKKVGAFYRCWTCKEAFLKAQGVGLTRGLDSFDVDLEGPGRLVATRPDNQEAGRWSLAVLEPVEGYAAAVALEGPMASLKIFRCG